MAEKKIVYTKAYSEAINRTPTWEELKEINGKKYAEENEYMRKNPNKKAYYFSPDSYKTNRYTKQPYRKEAR